MPIVRFTRQGRCLAALAGLLCVTTVVTASRTELDRQSPTESATKSDARPNPERARLQLDDIRPAPEKPAIAANDGVLSERTRSAIERAVQLRNEQRLTEATLELEKALRHTPDSPAVERELALTLWASGDAELARAHIESALTHRADDVVCHYVLGRLAARRFENAEGIRHFRTALLCTTSPETAAYRILAEYHLAEALRAEGYLAAAVETYERYRADLASADVQAQDNRELAALRRAGDAPILESMADALASLGEWDAAAERLGEASADTQMDADSRVKYAETLVRAGKLEEAAQQARLALTGHTDAIRILKRIREEQGKPDAFIADLRAAVGERPNDRTLIVAMAAALTESGDAVAATAWLRENIAKLNNDAELAWALFDVLVKQQEWMEAFAVAVGVVGEDASNASDAQSHIEAMAGDDTAWAAIIGAKQTDADYAAAFLLGVGEAARGDSDRAKAFFAKAIAAKPTFLPARLAAGELYLAEYDWQHAIDVAAPEGIVASPDSRIAYLLGRAYLGLDNLEEAEARLQTAVRLNHKNTDAMIELARVYTARNEPNRALRQLEMLVRTDPINETGREMLFAAYLREGDHRAAAEQLAELRRLAASPTCIARCVARIEFNADSAHSEERYRKTLEDAMAAYKPDVQTLSLVAKSYENELRFSEAIETLEKAVALGPVDTKTAEQLVRCYRFDLQFEAALEWLQRIAGRHPNRIAVRAAALDLLLVLQRFDDAIAMASAMIEESKDEGVTAALRSTLIQTHMLKEDYGTVVKLLKTWHEEEPDNVVLLRWLIATYQEADRHDEAMALLRRWPDLTQSGFSMTGLSLIWRNLQPNQYDEAIQLVMDDLLDNPDNDLLQSNLIDLLRYTKKFDEAIELAKNNMANDGDRSFYRIELYRTYDAAGRFDDAIELLNVMLAENTTTRFAASLMPIDLHIELAQLLIKSGKHAKALEKLNRWFEDARTNEEKLVYLGVLSYAHQEAGDLVEAIEANTLALELDPSNVGLHNDLGYTLADEGRDLERAEELVRFAVARDPRNSAFLDSLGWVLYKKGDYKGATQWLLRARFAGDGKDPVVCHHLGDAFWRLGDGAEAVRWWSQAAEFATERIEATGWPRELDKKTLEVVRGNVEAAQAGEDPVLAPVGPASP